MSRFIVLFILVGLFGCSSPRAEKNQTVEGLWKLHSMKIRNTETGVWSDYRGGMQGYLLYDGQKNMTIHLTDKDYEKTDLDFPSFTDTIPVEALKYLTKSYYYVGEYKLLNDSIVQHTRLSHSNPGDWGEVVKRHFSFKDDTLVITPTEQRLANLELKWVKPE
ncbi:MAG: lipocalin-like domain-containing protein [Salibacteraceae bacterium]